jgi:hypothetical protein
MFNNIQLNTPDFYFDVGSMTHHTEIYQILRDNQISKMYAYAIMYRKSFIEYEFLKIGQSCPEPGEDTEKAVGERLGRQLAWFDGWDYQKPKSVHGADFYFNTVSEIKNGNLPSYLNDKKFLCVGVWNVDRRAPNVANFIRKDRDMTEWVEGELASQHKKQKQCLPLLNYKDPTKNYSYVNCNVNVNHFSQLFAVQP